MSEAETSLSVPHIRPKHLSGKHKYTKAPAVTFAEQTALPDKQTAEQAQARPRLHHFLPCALQQWCRTLPQISRVRGGERVKQADRSRVWVLSAGPYMGLIRGCCRLTVVPASIYLLPEFACEDVPESIRAAFYFTEKLFAVAEGQESLGRMRAFLAFFFTSVDSNGRWMWTVTERKGSCWVLMILVSGRFLLGQISEKNRVKLTGMTGHTHTHTLSVYILFCKLTQPFSWYGDFLKKIFAFVFAPHEDKRVTCSLFIFFLVKVHTSLFCTQH